MGPLDPTDPRRPPMWLRLLLWLRSRRWFPQRITLELLRFIGPDIAPTARIGRGLVIAHRGTGVVIHERAVIGDRVNILHNVTLGRADVWDHVVPGDHPIVVIEDDVWLCTGAVVIGTAANPVTVGRGTVVGANAVLSRSTGEWEIWAGSPAKCVGTRPIPDAVLGAEASDGDSPDVVVSLDARTG
jgi:serine O-acetyltransferase